MMNRRQMANATRASRLERTGCAIAGVGWAIAFYGILLYAPITFIGVALVLVGFGCFVHADFIKNRRR